VPQDIVFVPPAETPAIGCANPYTVLPGEWMYRIATKCGVSAVALLAANSLIDPQWLMPGQLINMPGGSAAAAAPAATAIPAAPIATPVAFTGGGCAAAHVVMAGENLFRIAYNCGLSTEQMAARNGLRSPYIIYPGMTLLFP
jgi:membrane-bound lytic murein transglycosylase D